MRSGGEGNGGRGWLLLISQDSGLRGTLVRCLKCLVTLKRQYCSSAQVGMSSLTIPSSFPKVMNAVGGKAVTALAWGVGQVAYCTVLGVAMHAGSL